MRAVPRDEPLPVGVHHHDEHVVTVTLPGGGAWARSTYPHLLLVVDYDDRGEVIAVTAVGPLANRLREALTSPTTTSEVVS